MALQESKLFAKTGGLLLVGVTLSILSMLLLPIPPLLLDTFWAFNLTGALVLLLVSFHVSDPLHLASLPTILLGSTLFRLSLEIASSRLILTTGDAGQLIRSFGELAAAGNLVVGLVIFLIVTFVQFVVIAKGSERVAEVSARFHLDALPGRQMSIDADLRNGMVTAEEAKKARERLRQESKLFGALDGAMKFVKGDAIAGLFITGINLLGGITLGVFEQDLSIAQSLSHYSLLTIGSGLISQIPSLLVSMAAGVVLTRGTSEGHSHLGNEISAQILRQPKALGVGALLVAVLGLIPGFPGLTFFGLSLTLGGFALVKHRLQNRTEQAMQQLQAQKRIPIPSHSLPITLVVSATLQERLSATPEWSRFSDHLLPHLIQQLSEDVGINLPLPKVLTAAPHEMIHKDYLIKVQELPVLTGIVTTAGAPEELLIHLAKMLRRFAPKFLTMQEVKNRVKQLEASAPDLVQETIPRLITLHKLTDVLQRLVQEWIPIKDLQRILHELTLLNPEQKDPVTLTELLRTSLKDQISYRFAGPDKTIPLFLLSQEIEELVLHSIQRNDQEAYLTLPPQQLEAIVHAIGQKMMRPDGRHARAILLTRPEVRRFVRRMIEGKYHQIPVLSFQELDPEVVLRPLGKIELQESLHQPCELKEVARYG